MQKPDLPLRALISSGVLHLITSFLEREISEHEANFAKKGESGIDPEELEEYKQLAGDLERLYDTGVQIFEVRPWIYGRLLTVQG